MSATGLDPLAIGTEVRLGRVARENRETKSRRLLIEGRVGVRYVGPLGVRAFVKGDSGEVHRVTFDPGPEAWSCSCLARTPRCSHVMATQLVVIASAREEQTA